MLPVHMVQQVIKYSDGTEKVINYRGVIVDGELMSDEEVIVDDAAAEEVVEEVAEEVVAEEPAAEAAEEAAE